MAPIKPTVIICPGNGCTNIRKSNWYGRLANILEKEHGISCICENFPDPYEAKRDIWIPFIHEKLIKEKAGVLTDDKAKDSIILVGHSSGAQAALRYTELYSIKAAILVSATYSDLGDAGERRSGYYPRPIVGGNDGEETNQYDFDAMKRNCKIWCQFHSDDDPFIPLYEAEKICNGLGLQKATSGSGTCNINNDGNYNEKEETETSRGTYYMLPGHSHFFELFPELIDNIVSLC